MKKIIKSPSPLKGEGVMSFLLPRSEKARMRGTV